MKQIYIQGLTDERYIRPLEHIGNLFFEDTKILYSEAEEKADLHVHFETEIIDNEFIVRGKLEELEGGKSIESNADLRDLAEKEIFKQMKTAISKSYLLLLQEYTGMVQKWGILTGIRPTKLLHRHMQNQTPKEEAHQSLRAEYLMSDEKINLMQKIIDRQLAVIPDLYDLKKEVSIYIGIPFCPTKCAYCTFPAYAINGRQGSVSSFLGGLHYEMEKIGEWLKEKISILRLSIMVAVHQLVLRQKKWTCFMSVCILLSQM